MRWRAGRTCRAFFIGGLLFWVGFAVAADPPPLTVVSDDNYPPYIFRDADGTLQGYLVDSWALWEKKTGQKVTLIATDWIKAQQIMGSGRADVIDTIFQTPERDLHFDFSAGYANIPVGIYAHNSIGGVTSPGALKGFLIGVKSGDACIDRLRKDGVDSLQPYESYSELVDAAIEDKIKIFCLDEPPANYLLYKAGRHNDFYKGFTYYEGQFHRAYHKNAKPLAERVEGGFALITNNELQSIRKKWMGEASRLPYYIKYIEHELLFVVLSACALVAWVYFLRREVRRRAAEKDALLQNALVGVVLLRHRKIITCNRRLEEIFAYPAGEMLGQSSRVFYPSDEVFRDLGVRAYDILGRGENFSEALQLKRRNGEVFWGELTGRAIDPKQPNEGSIWIYNDISERKDAEDALRVAAAAFESSQGMVVSDAQCTILRVNKAFTEITGYSTEEAIGGKTNLLKSGHHDDGFYAAMWDSINRTGSWSGEIWNRRKNGQVYPEWLNITAVSGASGTVAHYVGTFNDITQRKEAEHRINELAYYDPLTNLPNRRLLMDRLSHTMAASMRNGREGALLFVDLDNFKTVNDTSGHDMGDQLLQEVAKRLASCTRDADTVARTGGDEFVVVLDGLSEAPEEAAAQAETVGEKILAVLAEPYTIQDREIRSTPSIGVTLFGNQKGSIEELLKQADIAMYQAKSAGRNALRFFDPDLQAVIKSRISLEADLRLGIGKGQFVLHYQPQLDDGHIIGAEALIRWLHPERGMISPAVFIALAEETGLILPLGRWVLENACAQVAAWERRGDMAGISVAVNVSAKQFNQVDFVEEVLSIIDRTGVDPERIKLELTESMLAENIEDVIGKMNALKSRGLNFSLDDFGTGYSSLSYLKRLPLDQLKIDQSFVRDVLTDPNDAVIARTIVALAKSLGLKVIAEGVETEPQRQFLAENGCQAYQGYLFSRPVPLHEFEGLVAAHVPQGSQAQ